ncbi:hypothetical protein [Nocardia sp. NPDC024068]|uniref:hypothetical protein n=1 Tax=Nocardia sp. NPDC024068 TaxID=3157197 RepID=UPI0033D0BDDA
MSLGEVAADLYGLAPGEFVAARTERARAATAAGDRELASAIGALRKPTVAAWTVNALVRAAPGEVEALLGLGEKLRTAQRELSGEQLRLLTRQRRQVVDALTARAQEVAAESGYPASAAVLRQVGETLTAALADPAVAERVRTATLATAAAYSGFGPVEPDLALVREEPESIAAAPRRKSRAKRAQEPGEEDPVAAREAEERRQDERLRAAEKQARADLDAAEQDARRAADELRGTESRVGELRDELAAAEDRHRFARQADKAAREAVRAATTDWERARRRLH